MSQDDQPQVNPKPTGPQPWRGDERTLNDAGGKNVPDAGADWAGAERTVPDAKPAQADSSDDDWDGNDRTMPDRPAATEGEADDWQGDDRTMPNQSADARPAEDWNGNDRTMPSQAALAADDDWDGNDRTIPAGATASEDPDADWSGHDQTLIGAGTEAERRPTERKTLSDSPSGSGSGSRSTGSPHPSRAASTSFDEAWHLDGRKGPFTGQVWGDWEIGGILGEGGMGAVYRGKQTSLKRRVAIKVLAPNLAQDPRLLQRFQLEARMTSMLSSPNLVQVFAAGEWEGNHFFVMEYVEGTDLYDVIRRRREANKLFTPDEAADVIIQAAKGLAEAGRYGMVHRDIKPSNLMVTNAGLVKVADFGIVKVLGESVLTMTGQAVGTPSYVSPEQGRGQNDIDQRSDIYSLGVVFYELLCDRKPFEATSPNALIYKHCYAEPELPRSLNAAISDEYQTVVLKCLQKKPENRYQNTLELIADLEAIHTGNAMRVALASGKLGTGAAEAQRENLSWVQRNLLPLVAGLVVLLLAGGAGGLWYYSTDQDRRARAADERQRASDLYQALSVLNDPRPLPAGARDLLEEYAGLAGADSERVAVWRAKILRVADLRERLERLDAQVVTAAVRADARGALATYREEVGLDDPAAAAWDARLQELARREAALRDQVGALDRLPSLNQTQRDAAQPLLDELAALAGADDAQASRTAARLVDFDRRRDGYLASLAILDNEATSITEAQARDLRLALDALTAMIDAGDPRLQRWAMAITAKGQRVAELRRSLSRLDRIDLPPLALQFELQRDLTALQELVPETDHQLRDWKARIAAANVEIASLRKRLAVLDGKDRLPFAAWEETDRLLTALATLAGETDADVIRWHGGRDAARLWLGEQRQTLERRNDPEPFSHLERKAVVAARDALISIGALSDREAAAIADRLAAEDAGITTLRTRLAVLDRVEPITPAARSDLAALSHRCDAGDADLLRWTARITAIDALRERLSVLDRSEPVPATAADDLDRLEAMIGTGDTELLRWRGKIVTVAALRDRLAVLDRVEPPSPRCTEDLARLAALIGQQDADLLRWQERHQRIVDLRDRLALLLLTTQQDDAAVAAARNDLADLAVLIGDGVPALRRLAQRQDHLDGPGRPSWAVDSGRDRIGLFADVDLPGGRQRLRFVPAGSFRMGSPTGEPGRDSDELQVEVHLTTAYWIADSECTQTQWQAVMNAAPARDRGDQRPVERITWDEARMWCATAASKIGSGFSPRLPSEAEWERACRADAEWIDRSAFDAIAWHSGNATGSSKDVRRRFQNPLGCFDLLGNVAEWCEDRYSAYPTGVVEDPLGAGGELHVARGGAWGDAAATLRIANRIPVRAQTRSAYLGFRFVVSAGETARWFPDPVDAELLRRPTAPAAHTAQSAPAQATPSVEPANPEATVEDDTSTDPSVAVPAAAVAAPTPHVDPHPRWGMPPNPESAITGEPSSPATGEPQP